MTDSGWTECGAISLEKTSLTGQWHCLAETVSDFTLLRFVAEGSWTPLPPWTASCGPDGMAGLRVDGSLLLLPDAPFGALIGKLGGSSITLAGWTDPAPGGGQVAAGLDGKPFAVGVLCILPIPRRLLGPILIGINVAARPVDVESLKIVLSGVLAPVAAAGTKISQA